MERRDRRSHPPRGRQSPGVIVGESDDGFRFIFQFTQNDGRTVWKSSTSARTSASESSLRISPVTASKNNHPHPRGRASSGLQRQRVRPYAPATRSPCTTCMTVSMVLAGDELPGVNGRSYRWAATTPSRSSPAACAGAGRSAFMASNMRPTIYPSCLAERFPESQDRLWRAGSISLCAEEDEINDLPHAVR